MANTLRPIAMTPFLRKSLLASVLISSAVVVTATAYAEPVLYGLPISNEQAKKVGSAAAAEARKNNWTVVVAVVDSSGTLTYLEKIDGTQIASVETAIGKAKTANNFKRPTKLLEDAVLNNRVVMLNLPGVLPLQGGLPIVVDGKIIGAIGVSGAKSQEDEQAAAAGISAIASK